MVDSMRGWVCSTASVAHRAYSNPQRMDGCKTCWRYPSKGAKVLTLLLEGLALADLKGWCNPDGAIGFRGWTDRGLQLHPDEYAALLAFRNATGHSDVLLDNWSDKIHPCEWCGVECACQTVRAPTTMLPQVATRALRQRPPTGHAVTGQSFCGVVRRMV